MTFNEGFKKGYKKGQGEQEVSIWQKAVLVIFVVCLAGAILLRCG